MREYNIVRDWASLKLRMFEYRILPPDPTVEWTKGAHLQPGKLIRCYKCQTEHPFEEMVAGVHGEFWTCPNGHVLRDESYRIREKPTTPQPPPAAPPANTMDDGDDGTDGDEMGELGEAYGALADLEEVLLIMRGNMALFDKLLNQRKDLLEEFRANDDPIEDSTVETAIMLLTAMQEDGSDVSS